MRASVLSVFPYFTAGFEGRLRHPYPDVNGQVTTALGFLCDSVAAMLMIPWQMPDGSLAPADVVAAAFAAIKARPDLWKGGGNTPAVRALTNIRITDAEVDRLTLQRLLSNETIDRVRTGSAVWDSSCADAQLGLSSLAWACGSEFRFPKFLLAFEQGNYCEFAEDGSFVPGCCAAEVFMSKAANPGNNLTRRNTANQALFKAAQIVKDKGLDPDVITGWIPDTDPELETTQS